MDDRKGKEVLLPDRDRLAERDRLELWAGWLDLVFVLWLIISVAFFLIQFESYIDPLLKRVGLS